MIKIDTPSKEVLIELRKDKNYTDVGRVYDVSRTTVRRWYEERGLHTKPSKKVVKVPTRDEMDKLISNGAKSEDLAAHYGVHVTTISAWLRSYSLLSFKARERFKQMAAKLEPVKPKVMSGFPPPKFMPSSIPQIITHDLVSVVL